jgi:hypothetical protein
MRGKAVEADWYAVMQAYGGPEKPSISELSRRFDLPESTIRSCIKRWDLPDDLLMRRLEIVRGRLASLTEDVDELERLIRAERDYHGRR